jgi:hypothetical protein
MSELPGMWDESDMFGGWADSYNARRFELHTVDVSESICEYSVGSMEKGDGQRITGTGIDSHRELIRAVQSLRPGQALVVVRRAR